MIRPIIRFGFATVGFTFMYFVGCSSVNFSELPQDKIYPNCVIRADLDGRCTYSGDANLGSVDILFVDDNSGSMSTEQSKMAAKFNNFIQTLDSQNIDYNIAITTTDISGTIVAKDQSGEVIGTLNNGPTEWNKMGELQDGKFIKFPNGATVLKSKALSQTDKINYFAQTIQRPETSLCDGSSNYTKCVSSDERGVYAINKVLDRADAEFFRKDAHFAVVILSDEDERSLGGEANEKGQIIELEPQDTPEYLVSRLADSLGTTKSMSVHSIIVPPGDFSCRSIQDSQGAGIRGQFGDIYAQLSNPSQELKSLGNIITGKVSSICADNYTNHLVDIASRISTSSFVQTLPCTPENRDVAAKEGFEPVQINVVPDPGFKVQYSVDDKNNVTFTPTLPAGSHVEYTVVCLKK